MNLLCTTIGWQCSSGVDYDLDSAFANHISQYGLSFGTQNEYLFRKRIFEEKTEKLNQINTSQSSFTVGYNKFTTWTDFEYGQLLNDDIPQRRNLVAAEPFEMPEEPYPDEVNWVKKGAVNPIRDMGKCGASWAFGAASTMESSHFIASNELLSLSEQ